MRSRIISRRINAAPGAESFINDRDEKGQPKGAVEASTPGNDAFVTDRDDSGKPKPPEKAEVPRVAAAADANNALAAIPTEMIVKIVEDLPKEEAFQQNPALQDALIFFTNVLKTRPRVAPEPAKGQEAVAAPVKAAGKKAGEPFGGKQAPPFGSKEKDEKKEDKKESSSKVAVAPPGWEGTVKEMKGEEDIDNPWALAWSMKNKGYKPHAASFLLKRKGAAWLVKKFKVAGQDGSWSWNQDTGDVTESGGRTPEIAEAHGMIDEKPAKLDRPATELPSKFAAETSTAKALKLSEEMSNKLKALYLDAKPICDANCTRPVREAVEAIYRAMAAFDGAMKVLTKQDTQEKQEEEAAEIKKNKKSSFGGLALVAAEE